MLQRRRTLTPGDLEAIARLEAEVVAADGGRLKLDWDDLRIFLAVAREGLESVFFLLAIFQQSPGMGAPLGALLGLALSVVLGLAVYRGGVRLDLRQFFTWTGIFIIFVAAGLFSSALRSLHEAGLWNHLQQPLYDLTRVLPVSSVPGTVLSGLLGYHDRPTLGEALGWALVVLGGLWFFLRPTPAPRLRVQG